MLSLGSGEGRRGEGGSAAPPYSAPWGWESPRPASSHPKTERAPQKEGEHPAPTLARRCAAIGAAFYQLELWGVPAPVWLAPNLGAAFWASFSPVVAPAQTLIPPAGRGWAQRYLLVTALWYSMYVLPSNAMASASPAAFSMITGGGKTGRCHGTEHGQARKTSLYPHLPSPGTCQHRASPWRGFTGALGLVNWEQVPVFAASRPETRSFGGFLAKIGEEPGGLVVGTVWGGKGKGSLRPGAISSCLTPISAHGAGAGVGTLLPAPPRATLELWGRGEGVPAPPASPFSQ